jgi:hypothetical protein
MSTRAIFVPGIETRATVGTIVASWPGRFRCGPPTFVTLARESGSIAESEALERFAGPDRGWPGGPWPDFHGPPPGVHPVSTSNSPLGWPGGDKPSAEIPVSC